MTREADSSATGSPRGRARFWMLLPFMLLGATLVGWGFMVAVALDDPSFSVEPDYYEKAVEWDQHQAQQTKNEELGWQIKSQLEARGPDMQLAIELSGRHGTRLRGARVSVRAFHVARGADVVEAVLGEREDGTYAATLPMRRPGIWEVRYLAERAGERFTAVQREELVLGGTR